MSALAGNGTQPKKRVRGTMKEKAAPDSFIINERLERGSHVGGRRGIIIHSNLHQGFETAAWYEYTSQTLSPNLLGAAQGSYPVGKPMTLGFHYGSRLRLVSHRVSKDSLNAY